MKYFVLILASISLWACSQANSGSLNEQIAEDEDYATVLSVYATGNELGYTFAVTISSPDTGCEQYADWWEVIRPEGELIYRRILAHSHVDEQPFTRSGGAVNIKADEVVIIRSHMSNTGYGTQALRGSVKEGFKPVELAKDFAQDLANQAPQPGDCPN